MNLKDAKCILGNPEAEKPAVMRLFDTIDDWCALAFVEEFLWLQEYVKPSKIVVQINSDGGSIVNGMSIFSVIQSCPIEVDCVIEGIAASMASVVWAAGDNLYMHDYSILMVHNPFLPGSDGEDPDAQAMVGAFKKQIATIYRSRLGLDEATVESMMNGEEGVDGTYFDAQQAVGAGIIDQSNIIYTEPSKRQEILNKIDGISIAIDLKNALHDIAASVNYDAVMRALNQNKKEISTTIKNKMETNEKFAAIAMQLGLSEGETGAKVSERIADLLNSEKRLASLKAEFDALKIEATGKDTALQNANEALKKINAELQVYKDEEEAAHERAVQTMVQDAVDAGKIDESAKASWVEMAKTNFEVVKNTLASIPAREVITKAIAISDDNRNTIDSTMQEVEAEIKKKVEATVGKGFQLKSF